MTRDLISLSAFPKSGVTYLGFLMFHALFNQNALLHELERKYIIDVHAWPSLHFNDPAAPRLIKSHFAFDNTRPYIKQTAKAIYLIRHPIDVMMSAWDYNQYLDPNAKEAGSSALRLHIKEWLKSAGGGFDIAGTWRDHVRSWTKQQEIPIYLVKYTDLVDHPRRELAAIVAFLGLTVPEHRLDFAVERSTMKAMAALEADEAKDRRQGVFYRSALARGYEEGRRFVNKGYRDCYDSVLTDEERDLADHVFGDELRTYFVSRQGQ